MSRLKFEKVGDVNSVYPYLCIYMEGHSQAFMEIFVDEHKQLGFQFYASDLSIILAALEIEEILEQAEKFLPKAIENGDLD